MDAFAVSIACGFAIKQLRLPHALRIAFSFGLFQAAMPLIGWLGGVRLKTILDDIDHWIAFAILSFIGAKMIYEATRIDAIEKQRNPLEPRVLLALSVATSLDALAMGFSFALLNVAILTPVLVIGGVTFLISLAGVWIGDRGGHFFERKIEILSGLILIGIGVKIVVHHLTQG